MQRMEIDAPNFDLEKTLDSGQVFHWQRIGHGFVGVIGDAPVYVEQRGNVLKVNMEGGAPATPGKRRVKRLGSQGFVPPVAYSIAHYFALDHPLAEICASFPDDPVMNAAREFTNPPARRIAGATEHDLRECALGYRAKNLLVSAQLVSSGEADLEVWSGLSDPDLREKLCSLPGVGAKVANCVMLFAYERLRAFPIDIWIERVLKQQYFPQKKKITELELREFSDTYFGENGGYAQQYLFHHARRASRRSTMAKNSDDGPARPRAEEHALCGPRAGRLHARAESGKGTARSVKLSAPLA